MAQATLAVGNKMYSSWSMRPWILLRHFGIPFTEVFIRLRQPDTRDKALQFSPTGLVPAFVQGDVRAWESIAIIDTVADLNPRLAIWPRDPVARAHARSMAAEMHAGFPDLRANCSMNLGKRFAARDRGAKVQADVDRIVAMWTDARQRFGRGGPFLFGGFTAVDAMYAPVVSRLETYSFPVPKEVRAYMDVVQATPAYQDWTRAALEEPWVIQASEVDETPIAVLRKREEIAA
ncbi:MAG TPA: glutathione S-transferase family protein [Candidatus Thermoplasmatota archaeon]|nr:glutathione S-transferase family protein [Candidatus Thermoplasmatota archaeon]